MKNVSRKQNGASPQDSARNSLKAYMSIRKMLRRLWGLLLIGENYRSERLVELLLKKLLI